MILINVYRRESGRCQTIPFPLNIFFQFKLKFHTIQITLHIDILLFLQTTHNKTESSRKPSGDSESEASEDEIERSDDDDDDQHSQGEKVSMFIFIIESKRSKLQT